MLEWDVRYALPIIAPMSDAPGSTRIRDGHPSSLMYHNWRRLRDAGVALSGSLFLAQLQQPPLITSSAALHFGLSLSRGFLCFGDSKWCVLRLSPNSSVYLLNVDRLLSYLLLLSRNIAKLICSEVAFTRSVKVSERTTSGIWIWIWNVVDKLPSGVSRRRIGDGELVQTTLEAVDGSRLGGFFVKFVTVLPFHPRQTSGECV